MLDSLSVSGFKLFRRLEIPRLARLNLFVGSNNAGKSCLLEAIRLFTANGSPTVIRDLVRSRDGDWETTIARRQPLSEELAVEVESPIRFLFHDFHCESDPTAIIEIGSRDESQRLRLSLALFRSVDSEDGTSRMVRIESANDEAIEDAQEMLEILVGKDRKRILRLETLWRRNFAQRTFFASEPSSKSIVAVGTNGISPDEVSFLWDQVSLTPQQEKILACLRIIEPKIEGLTLIGDSARNGDRERTPVIRVHGKAERYPLRTMGDGLTRLFHIALAIVNAQDGVVTIDEFENGLYWEVQHQLWPVIFQLAEEFNVQIFATSHSSDCLQSFVDACSVYPSLGSIYRLERMESSAQAFSLPMTNVSDALAAQVEVR